MEEKKSTKGSKMSHHEDREDIVGEHKFSDLGQLIFFVIFAALWGIDSFYLHFSTLLTDYIPIYVSAPIGGIMLLLALYFAYWGLRKVFNEVRDPPEVIRSGVFKYTRHPIYFGMILLYLGLTIITLSIASLGLLVIIVFFYDFIASYEEELVVEHFIEDY